MYIYISPWHQTECPNSILHSQLGLYNTPTAFLQRGKTPFNECPVYDTKQSDGEVTVMLELWGMPSTPLRPLLPGQLWPGVVAPDKALSMGQIEHNWESLLFLQWNCVLMLNWIARNRTVFSIETVLSLNWIVWSRTVWLNWIACNKMFLTIKLWTHAKLNCLKKNWLFI